MSTRIGSLKVVLKECPYCGYSVAIDGLLTDLKCDSCHKGVAVVPSVWKDLLLRLDDMIDEYGDGHSETVELSGEQTFKATLNSLGGLSCRKCQSIMPVDGVDTNTVAFSCSKCGEQHDARKTPPSVGYENAKLVIDAVAAQSSFPSNTAKSSPVSMDCPSCARSLKITQDQARVTTCEFCDGEFLVPKLIWNKLHPVKPANEWCILFTGKTSYQLKVEGEQVAEREAQRREEEERIKKEKKARQKKLRRKKTELKLQESDFRSTALIGYGFFSFIGIFAIGFPFIFSETLANVLGPAFCSGVFSVESFTNRGTTSLYTYCTIGGVRETFYIYNLYGILTGMFAAAALWTLYLPVLYAKSMRRLKGLRSELEALEMEE